MKRIKKKNKLEEEVSEGLSEDRALMVEMLHTAF